MSLSAEEKLRVAHVLDGLGFHMIEAGFPASNPKEEEFFGLLARETFRTAQIAAFGMTRRRDLAADEDPALRAAGGLLRARLHARRQDLVAAPGEGRQGRREDNLRMIEESVAFLVAQGKTVVYDAEHFFDAWRDDPAYALRCLRAAVEAGGATWLTLCDTNGATLPDGIAAAPCAACAASSAGRRPRHPLPQRRGVRRRQLAGRGAPRAPAWSRAR